MCLARYFNSSNKLLEKKIIFRVKSSGDIPIYQALERRLPQYLMRIASSYLEDRMLTVETEGCSTEVEITAEVAQESVGGPTIWNVHYVGLLRFELPEDVTLVGYTDGFMTWLWCQ